MLSDSLSLGYFSLKVYHCEIMLALRPGKTNDNHGGLLSTLSYNNIMDKAFLSGVATKALSMLTGDTVSAVCECQEAASGSFGPSKDGKSQPLPHTGRRAL
jgi:hypothetical protein